MIFYYLSSVFAVYCVDQQYMCFDIGLDESGENMIVDWKISNNVGWAGFGVGSSMMHSDMVVAWRNKEKIIISPRFSSGRHLPEYVEIDSLKILTQDTGNPSFWHITFSRPLKQKDGLRLSVNEGINSFIYGFAAESPNSDDPTSGFSFHSNKGAFDHSVVHGSSSGGGRSKLINNDVLRGVHGYILTIMWIIMTPISVILARYCKHIGHKWFVLHSAFQFITVTCTIVLGLLMEDTYAWSFESTHEIVGTIIICIGTLQVYSGCFIHLRYNPSRSSVPKRDKAHGITGFIIWFLSIYQMISGLINSESKLRLYIFSVIALAMLIAMVIMQMQKRRNGAVSYQKVQMGSF